MTGFALTAPKRTIFGRDCRATAAAEIAGIGPRVLLVRGRSVAWVGELAADLIRSGCCLQVVYSAGEPDLEGVRNAVAVARDHRAECIVSVGGGATLDLGKAVAGLCVSEGDVAEYLALPQSVWRNGSILARNNSGPARPYMARLSVFRRLI